jgi:hypothetical protein
VDRTTRLVVVLLLLVLAGAATTGWLWYTIPGPRPVLVPVTGAAGTRVSVTTDADGERRTEEHDVPCEVARTATTLTFRVTPVGRPPGPLFVEVLHDGVSHGQAGSAGGADGRVELQGRTIKSFAISGL